MILTYQQQIDLKRGLILAMQALDATGNARDIALAGRLQQIDIEYEIQRLPSDLINQAISNCTDGDLALQLLECMKKAALIEIKNKTGNRN